jgi:putative endonuclease
MPPSDQLGAEGRAAVRQYLKGRGWRVLDERWQHPDGRLDLLAVDNGTLVVCELRGRTSRQAAPFGALSAARRRLLRTMAVDWLQEHGMRFDQIRIDVVRIIYEDSGGFAIEHVREAE